MVKQIKVKDELHAKIMRECPKIKTISEYIDELLAGEPFIEELQQVLSKTIEKTEANKKNAYQADLNAADELIRVCAGIVKTCEQRSKKEDE